MIHFKIGDKLIQSRRKSFFLTSSFVNTATKTCEYHGKYEIIIIKVKAGDQQARSK